MSKHTQQAGRTVHAKSGREKEIKRIERDWPVRTERSYSKFKWANERGSRVRRAATSA